MITSVTAECEVLGSILGQHEIGYYYLKISVEAWRLGSIVNY